MPHRSRSVVHRSSSKSGEVAWSAFTAGVAFQGLALSTAALVQVGLPTVDRQTILRVRGVLAVRNDQEAADEDSLGAFGLAVVQEPAATVGITALPLPFTDGEFGAWFVHQAFTASTRFADATGFTANAGREYQIDSKAMRKLGGNERVVFVMENGSSIAGLSFWYFLRILSKIH